MSSKTPIDFVVPWVDDSDPAWIKDYRRFNDKSERFSDSALERYRNWNIFKFWFRGVEKNAPWVNKIHLITCGHYPEWLNLGHPKLNFVKHSDYIPKEFLPTFSSHTIELNMHRIKGLSERFVYFNDDIIILNKSNENDFFYKDLPRDSAILTAYNGLGISNIALNCTGIINEYFKKNKVIFKNPLNWCNFKYGAPLMRTFLLMPWSNFTGFYDYHLTNSFLKSTFEEVWAKESETLSKTAENKFRNNKTDVNQYLMRFWQLASGKFYPSNKSKLGNYFNLGVDPIEDIVKGVKSSRKPLVCLNDSYVDPSEIEETQRKIMKVLEEKLPDKSSFEK